MVENCSTLERDLEYIKNNIIVTVPMILLMDDVNLQVVIAILMSKDTSMPNLESETTDPKSCSLISRILKCPAIDECWKAKHLSHLRPDQSALSNAHSALNQ